MPLVKPSAQGVMEMVEKTLDESSLEYVLLMAQESLCPPTYDKFVDAYNELVKTRRLNLDKVD